MFLDIQDVWLFHGHGDKLKCCGRGNVDVILVGENASITLPICKV